MDGPRRKITAKVNPDAVPSPVPTRPPSQASNILDVSSLSPPAAIRPKAKLSAGATASSLKPTVPKSGGSTVASGRKTPASSVAGRTTRERPASLISAPAARSTASSQPASPMNPSMSTRRPRSPQPPRGVSPMSRITARRIKSPEPPPMSPSPSNPRRGLAPSPAPASGSTLSRRATSPSVRSTRPRESPVPVPPLTIPRRGASPTRPSPFNHNSQPLRNRTTSHRRIASASSALSGSSVAPAPLPEPTKPRVLQSLSAITLDGPPPFSAIPKSPPRSAQPDLSFPSPSPSPSLSPLPAADPPEPSIESQDDDSSSASIEQSEEASQSSTPPSATPPVPSIPLITSSAPATPSHIEVTSAPLDLTSSSATLVVQDTPLIASSAPVTPSYVQPTPPRPRTSSVSLAPHPPNNLLSNLASGMRITAKVSPATLAAASASARSSSGGSTISGIAPSMISGMSSIRVGANSRILSPPPDRRIPFVGLNLQGSTFPVPIGSPPASIVSSMSSASRHSRSTSFSRHSRSGSFADGARTPTDVGLRPRLSGGGASALGIAIEDEGGGGVERDDSGIDMFEADDGEEHHGQREARSNRKIADLEISNKSLLAINASLEATKARQAKEIRDLRRKLRESRLVLPPKTFAALEESDPLKDSGSASSSNSDSDDNDVTQTQADETFDRVRRMLDQMIEGAKQALETGTVKLSEKASGGPSIRVLNKMDVHGEENGTEEEEEESEDESEESEDSEESEEDDADSAMGELSSIDGVSPMEEHPPVRVGANAKIIEAGSGAGGGTFSAITSSLGMRNWR